MAAAQLKDKDTAYWGVPWEQAYGYPQARRVGNEIFVSGQFNHDADGNLVAPAPLDSEGRPSDFSTMGEQMRTAYDNIATLLALYGATLQDVVEETKEKVQHVASRVMNEAKTAAREEGLPGAS